MIGAVPTPQPPVASAPILSGRPPSEPEIEMVVEASAPEEAPAPAGKSSRTRLYLVLVGLAVIWLVVLFFLRRR